MIDTIEVLTSISRKAGSEILNIYHNETLSREIESKSDNSPLTLADKASNRVIVNSLQNSFPDIPILSEEEKHVEYGERSKWKRFWLVDPLDGTKEFIKRNGEFTVNIALIDKGYPVLGIIYAPVLDTLYLGIISEKIAYKIDEAGVKTDLKVNNKSHRRTAVGSRSHSSREEADLLGTYDVVDTISVGSSLKFCMVAEGKADIYYRHGPTMEWDTCAGQAIVEASGGTVTNMQTRERFNYNKENLLNGSFLVKGF
jgi:3'(2'), 5'-bisphosphate nucleotidase